MLSTAVLLPFQMMFRSQVHQVEVCEGVLTGPRLTSFLSNYFASAVALISASRLHTCNHALVYVAPARRHLYAEKGPQLQTKYTTRSRAIQNDCKRQGRDVRLPWILSRDSGPHPRLELPGHKQRFGACLCRARSAVRYSSTFRLRAS